MAKILDRYSNNLIREDALLDLKKMAEKNKANLRGAKIANKTIINYKELDCIGGSRRQLRCFMLDDNSFYFMAGCFSGTEKELKAKVLEKYGKKCEYMEAIAFLKKISEKYKMN